MAETVYLNLNILYYCIDNFSIILIWFPILSNPFVFFAVTLIIIHDTIELLIAMPSVLSCEEAHSMPEDNKL